MLEGVGCKSAHDTPVSQSRIEPRPRGAVAERALMPMPNAAAGTTGPTAAVAIVGAVARTPPAIAIAATVLISLCRIPALSFESELGT